MPVIAMWKCDRDGSKFDSKQEAGAYDKFLELGEQFTDLRQDELEAIDRAKAESFGSS